MHTVFKIVMLPSGFLDADMHSYVVESRQQREQRSNSAVEAPWIFVRDPAKLLRPRCALYALAAIKALPLQLYDLCVAQLRRFCCALGALSAFPRCFNATLMATELHFVYFPALKTFHISIHFFKMLSRLK